uniref:Erg28 n=1 Tax=Solanum tuberosum TaxID=4113 RepID=M1A1N2_SOLTU
MELLGWWLMLVGTLRLASVWFGFVDIWALRVAVFSKTTNQEFKLVYWAEGLSETVTLRSGYTTPLCGFSWDML